MNNSDLIYYNFMTKPANHCLDMTDEYYKSCGVSRGNNNGFDISKLKDGDIIFVKSDYIFNGMFQANYLNSIKTKFILISGVSSYSVDEGVQTYKNILNINQNNDIKDILYINIYITKSIITSFVKFIINKCTVFT